MRIGTLEIIIIKKVSTVITRYTGALVKANTSINKMSSSKIFTRASMRCKKESPGKYCPIIILFNMEYLPEGLQPRFRRYCTAIYRQTGLLQALHDLHNLRRLQTCLL